jgi:anti-sigma-K factor RskA
MSDSSHESRRDDVSAYALGALEPDECAEFELHLAGCEQCRQELRWFTPAVEVLAETVERVEPPPQLRENLMETVHAEAARSAARPRSSQSRLRNLVLRPAIGIAAVALIAAAVFGYSLRGGGGGTDTITGTTPAGGSVQAMLSRKDDSGTLELTGLSQLPSDEVYQAWVQRDGKMEPSSLFAPRDNGTASAAIPQHLNGAQGVLVTIEPQGGSMAPTSPPLVRVGLSS